MYQAMYRAIVAAVLLCAASPAPAAALQGEQAAPPAIQKPKPPAPGGATEPIDTPARRPWAQAVNLRIELTITDQRGPTPAATKTVTALVADRELGRIRTSGSIRIRGSLQPITLNVDVHPEVLRDGRIKTQVTLEYRAQAEQGSTTDENQPTNLSEMFTVILEDGKPVMVTQSADPASDRKVKVDLKATLLK